MIVNRLVNAIYLKKVSPILSTLLRTQVPSCISYTTLLKASSRKYTSLKDSITKLLWAVAIWITPPPPSLNSQPKTLNFFFIVFTGVYLHIFTFLRFYLIEAITSS